MALAHTATSKSFQNDQVPLMEMRYWDTVYTPESEGIEFSLFTLNNPVLFEDTVGKVPTAISRTTMEGTLNNTSMTTSVLGYYGGVYRTGVAPNVYKYWGSGALPGITLGSATVLKFRGDVKITDTVTLIFGGQGRIQVYKNGTQIAMGELHEPLPDPSIVSLSEFQSQGGYVVLEDHSFTIGDDLEIYYWHNGEPWGGLFLKILDDITNTAGSSGYDEKTIRGLLRDAPIASASFFGIEANGVDLAYTTVPYLEEISLDRNEASMGTAVARVVLTTSDQPNGFYWDQATRTLEDNASSVSLKEERRIELITGYAKPGDPKNSAGIPMQRQKYEYNTGTAPSMDGTPYALGQTFQVPQGYKYIYSIWFYLRDNSATGNIVARVQSLATQAASGLPNGSLASVTVDTSLLPQTALGWYEFKLATPLEVTPGTWYAVTGENQGTGSNFLTMGTELEATSADAGQQVSTDTWPATSGWSTSSTVNVMYRVDYLPEVYTRFTGHISKIEISSDFQTAEIHCSDFSGKLMDTYDENYPDRLSYHANGYIFREGGHEPMFPIPAFDAWPLETAVAEYCYRSGIDSKYLGKAPNNLDPDFSRRSAYTATASELRYLRKLFQARHLGAPTKTVPLEKNSAYGNVGVLKKDWLPDDTEYLYKPEITRRLYDRATELCEHYGYKFLFDSLGRAYIRPGDNADEFFAISDAVSGGYTTPQVSGTVTGSWGSAVKQVSAVGGTYMYQDTGDTFTIVVSGYFSRLDFYTGIGLDSVTGNNGGVIDYDVEKWDGTAWVSAGISGSFSTYYDGAVNYFNDGLRRSNGTNASVFTVIQVPFDRYRVTFENGGLDPLDSGTGDYRLNGISVYYQDPGTNVFPVEFATDTNVFSLTPENNQDDLRNHVIVVGSRKGVLTDSSKISGVETNPNNLEYEFNVHVASDAASIYDKAALNFVGNKRIAIIYDDKISDSDFARWLALVTLYRYREPKYTVPLKIAALPMLELGDAMAVYEAAQESVDTVVWVQSFRESWSAYEATVSINTNSYPEIPSYQPKLTPDVDGLYAGQPAANLRITYRNLLNYANSTSGVNVTNADITNPTMVVPTNNRVAMTHDGNDRQALSTTLMPETLWLEGESQVALTTLQHRALVNNPYRRFWFPYSWDGSHFPTLQYDIQEGDDDSLTTGVYSITHYDMPSTSNMVWYLNYKSFNTRSGDNPFYDPYSSELGYFVNIKFNAIVSGRYRVSIWDALRSDGLETPVAWLTNPKGKALEPEDHWIYLDQQNDVEFNWDGVDNIGIWNRKQSRDYALRHSGSFGEEPLAVGEGFYVWNDATTPLTTQIGDNVANNYRGAGGDIRTNSYPYFTIGKYGKFYVKIEVLNDDLIAIDQGLGYPLGTPRVVRSDTNSAGAGNLALAADHSHTQLYIWTHLGEPNQVAITIQDWDPDNGNNINGANDWTPGTGASDWGSLNDSSGHPAIIRNGKPVKFTFAPVPRPGPLFGDNAQLTSAQLIRQVHLQATIMDQFWTFYSDPWTGIKSGNDLIPKKRLTSRMFHNNDKTKEWKDNAFRTGTDIAAYTWYFQPEFFELDFGKGFEESIEYGDYEQLEALPGYNARSTFGDDTSYLTLAFMNYLFYMSAYTLDRSGRRQWMLDRNFIDRSMIATADIRAATAAEYKLDYESKGSAEYLRRSMFVREWRDAQWLVSNAGTPSATRTPLSPKNTTHPGTGGITDADEHEWLQFPITYLDPTQATNLIMDTHADHEDLWYEAYASDSAAPDDKSHVNRDIRQRTLPAFSKVDKVLPATGTKYILPHAFNSWGFMRGDQVVNWYKPSPKRDFHPYWKPGMPNYHIPRTSYYVASDLGDDLNWNATAKTSLRPLHVLASPCSNFTKPLRDPMGTDNWVGNAFQWNNSISVPAQRGARLEATVEQWASEDVRSDLIYSFDYVRQDQLARYEFFRGIWSRGPFTDRDDGSQTWGVPVDSGELGLGGPRQRVKPSGVYFLNLGRYTDFVTGMAQQETNGDLQHFTRGIHDWYYMRFRHEYVWYNERHFPVSTLGTALYEFYRYEYTGIVGRYIPWAFTNIVTQSDLRFDSGAWVGWKDDVAINDSNPYVEDWTDAPALRWGEASNRGFRGVIFDFNPLNPNGQQPEDETQVFSFGNTARPWSSGGYQFYDTSAPAVGDDKSGDANFVDYWQTIENVVWRVQNIFDLGKGEWGTMRLAVGPELAVSREMWMNLVLPTRLKS